MSDTIEGARVATGCYLFGICPAGSRLALERVAGVGGGPVRTASFGPLQAVVEEVSLDDFSTEALEERLGDLQWVEEKARAHDRVERALMEQATVLPFRFCTILEDPDDLEKLMYEKRSHFEQLMARVSGAFEWGVKFIERAAPPAPPAGDGPQGPAMGEGAAYLMRKQRERKVREERQRRAREVAVAFSNELAGLAREHVAVPARREPEKGKLLNRAYLVDQKKEVSFSRKLASLQERAEAASIELHLTGPWPPYSFVTD